MLGYKQCCRGNSIELLLLPLKFPFSQYKLQLTENIVAAFSSCVKDSLRTLSGESVLGVSSLVQYIVSYVNMPGGSLDYEGRRECKIPKIKRTPSPICLYNGKPYFTAFRCHTFRCHYHNLRKRACKLATLPGLHIDLMPSHSLPAQNPLFRN